MPDTTTQQPPFYGHHTGKRALAAAPPVKNWRILWLQSFIAHMPLLMATSAFRLGRRRWSYPQ